MKYYMGIDNGGTTTKAALYREDGFCAGVASTETAMLVPRAGFTERDMEEMWQANCTVIRDVIAQTGIDAADIAGVAFSDAAYREATEEDKAVFAQLSKIYEQI